MGKTVAGFLGDDLKRFADNLLTEDNFTLICLHGHLLVEQALNHKLTKKGVPDILLGEDGLTFHQKYEAYVKLYAADPFQRKLFRAVNRLRNNIAHRLWTDEAECLRSALKYAFDSKKERGSVEQLAGDPKHSARWLFVGILNDMGALDTVERRSKTAG